MKTLAIGPFDPADAHAGWPLAGLQDLRRQGWRVLPWLSPDYEYRHFPSADVLVVWSPEYLNLVMGDLDSFDGYKVACIGDWHIRMPSAEELSDYDLLCSDWRGCRKLVESGTDEDAVLWYRMFSYDPRLHSPYPIVKRDLDVAFMGRADGGVRDRLRERIATWARRTGHTYEQNEADYPRGMEADVYRRAKIVFNFSQRGELNMRTYEAAACGALSVLQHDAVEVYRSSAPIPTYDPAHVEDFLEAWLTDNAARSAAVVRQKEWVVTETPIRHLEWLIDRIDERLKGGEAGDSRPLETTMTIVAPAAPVEPLPAPPENEQRPEVVALVPPTARMVLDLGCHQGGVGWLLKQRNAECAVWGVDVDARMRERCLARLDEFWQFDFNNAGEVWQRQAWYREEKFDCLIMADVLEHVVAPEAMLHDALPLLRPGGCVVFSIPNIRNLANMYELLVKRDWHYHKHGREPWRGPHDNVLSWSHLRFFTRRTVEELFASQGWRVEEWASSQLEIVGESDTEAEEIREFDRQMRTLLTRHSGAATWKADAYTIQWMGRAVKGGGGLRG